MKNDQYFPLEVNLMNNERMHKLIRELGTQGLGIYLLLLIEIRRSDNYTIGENAIYVLSKTNGIKKSMLYNVINNYNLFEWIDDGEERQLASPYMERVMVPLDELRKKRSAAAKKRANKMKRNADGQFTDSAPTEEKSKEEKSRECTTTASAAAVVICSSSSSDLKPFKRWEEILDDLSNDPLGMERLAIYSGLGKLFVRYQADIVEIFRQHIALHGSGIEIQSQHDIRTYFANFLRPGTPTHKRLEEQLRAMQKRDQKQNESPFETIDQATGQRSYFGNIIPDYAPPRPNVNACWDDQLKKWV